nr:MAG TPA: hypothetical protein [Caudoviricetes sp.]
MHSKPDGIFGVFDVVRDFYEHGIDEHLWVFLLMNAQQTRWNLRSIRRSPRFL